MKAFNQLTFILLISLSFLVSCGDKNKSGGSSGDPAPNPVPSLPSSNWYVQDVNDGKNQANYERLRNYFQAKSLASGLSDNQIIYHMGSSFGGASLNNQVDWKDYFKFDIYTCVNIFGILKGDCAKPPVNTQNDQLKQIVRNGRYLAVISRNSESIEVDRATGVDGYSGFQVTPETIDRNNAIYKKMLNLDAREVYRTVISKAYVRMSDGKQIDADYIEYFFRGGSVEGYVISKDLPTIANPLVVTKNHRIEGVLNFFGSQKVQSMNYQTHRLSFDYNTNTYREITRGSGRVTF